LTAVAALIGSPALAQTMAGDGVDPAPGAAGPYLGAPPQAFYDVDSRMAAMEARIQALSGQTATSAASELRAIRALAATQRARHGGELRDWDREAITVRLNRLEQRLG
jgi:hypothetical protein